MKNSKKFYHVTYGRFFSNFNPYGYFLSFPGGSHEAARSFLRPSSDAEKHRDYEYMIQIAVRDDNKGHIDDFREKTYEKNRIFFGKKIVKNTSRISFKFSLVPKARTCS